jgi:hypothetical protein
MSRKHSYAFFTLSPIFVPWSAALFGAFEGRSRHVVSGGVPIDASL